MVLGVLAAGGGCAGPRGGGESRFRARKLIEADRMLIIAHRGYSGVAPENTSAAFRRAVAVRADLVEFDYHVSRDGQAVVIHDDTLDRTTDAVTRWGGKKLKVADYPLGRLRRLDAGSWFDAKFTGERLPTLAEACGAILSGGVPLIERKAGDGRQLVELLRDRGWVDDVVVQSFDWDFLAEVHRLEPRIMLGALGGKEFKQEYVASVRSAGAAVVGWRHSDLSPDDVRRWHEAGLRVWCYTVDDPNDAKRMAAAGVDGIITNQPERIREALGAADQVETQNE